MRRKWLLVGFVVLLAVLVLAACAVPPPPAAPASQEAAALQARVQELEAQLGALQTIAGPPPASLDALYPPKAKAPLWTLGMLAMDNALNSTISDVAQGDLPGATANWDRFTQQYSKMSQMAPAEWKDRFPTDFLDVGAQALKSGDVSGFFANMGAVGAVCGGCHAANMANVQYKYDWPDFGQITVSLPPKQEQKSWSEMMQALAMTMAGVGNDLRQGQLDNARHNFQAFSATFDVLAEACSNCHKTPRAYFVDDSVRGDIDALGAALQADAPDGKAVGDLLAKIGGQSCGGCHAVHEPAALAKERWARTGQ